MNQTNWWDDNSELLKPKTETFLHNVFCGIGMYASGGIWYEPPLGDCGVACKCGLNHCCGCLCEVNNE